VTMFSVHVLRDDTACKATSQQAASSNPHDAFGISRFRNSDRVPSSVSRVLDRHERNCDSSSTFADRQLEDSQFGTFSYPLNDKPNKSFGHFGALNCGTWNNSCSKYTAAEVCS
jgi:hypothetical protein